MRVDIPVSVGELLDKISILSIKLKYTENDYVKKELNSLILVAKENKVYEEKYVRLLKEVNSALWDIEDKIRKLEEDKDFSSDFVELARRVYKTNDERYKIKKEINDSMGSEFKEVKHFSTNERH